MGSILETVSKDTEDIAWKTVLSRSHPVGDKPGYLEKQYSQDAPVSEPAKPGYNVKSPLRNSSYALRSTNTFLGQFWRPLDCILSRIPRKKVESWPKIPGEVNVGGSF